MVPAPEVAAGLLRVEQVGDRAHRLHPARDDLRLASPEVIEVGGTKGVEPGEAGSIDRGGGHDLRVGATFA
jgi:hypothetical protein